MKKTRLGLSEKKNIDLLNKDEFSKFKYQILKKNSMVYSDNITLVIIKEGSAKLSFFEDGDEFIIYHVLKNNITILDESCALQILEDSKIYSLDIENGFDFFDNIDFIKENTEAFVDIILLQRKIIRSILFESVRGRIANFLIELAKEQDLKQNGYYYLFLPFSLKVLSSFIGLKRQSVSTAFNEFIKDGVIKKLTQHEFLILNLEKLKSYTNYNE